MLCPAGAYRTAVEDQAHAGFADAFPHASEFNAQVEELIVSLCAVLLAQACNSRLEPMIKHQLPALTWQRLHGVKQNFLRAEHCSTPTSNGLSTSRACRGACSSLGTDR
ncbi:Tn3 family transposase [Pseudomonas sp. RT6P73]